MITDDQVVALLRDAGSAGPLPTPVDPAVATTRARRDRTRIRGLTGLAVASVAIALLLSTGTPWLATAASGDPATAASTRLMNLGLVVLGIAALSIPLLAIAVPFALRLPETARRRSALGAYWGVVALAVLSFTTYTTTTFLVWPQDALRQPMNIYLPYVAAADAVLCTVVALMLLARRRLRPSSVPPVSGTLWLFFAFLSGTWLMWVAYQQFVERWLLVRGTMTSFDAYGFLALAVLIGGAALFGAFAARRSSRRRGQVVGGTLLVVGSAGIGGWGGLLLDARSSTGVSFGGPAAFVVLLLAAAVAVAVIGARAWVGGRAAGPWVTALLAAVAASGAFSTGLRALTALSMVARIGQEHRVLPQALWAVALGLLSIGFAYALDRRLGSEPDADADEISR